MTNAEIRAELIRSATDGVSAYHCRQSAFNEALNYKLPSDGAYGYESETWRTFYLLVAEAIK